MAGYAVSPPVAGHLATFGGAGAETGFMRLSWATTEQGRPRCASLVEKPDEETSLHGKCGGSWNLDVLFPTAPDLLVDEPWHAPG